MVGFPGFKLGFVGLSINKYIFFGDEGATSTNSKVEIHTFVTVMADAPLQDRDPNKEDEDDDVDENVSPAQSRMLV